MKLILLALLIALSQFSFSQSKNTYLKNNRSNLLSADFSVPNHQFKVLGFGAYHGSQKTEEAEHILLSNLLKNGRIKYYLPETDFALGYYFNDFLKSGDTVLLKDLVKHYGKRVPQEKSIETYKKWKAIKLLNDSQPKTNRLEVVGIDYIVTYKYTVKLLTDLLSLKQAKFKSYSDLIAMIKTDTTDYSPNYDSYSKGILKRFVEDYQAHQKEIVVSGNNQAVVNHLIKNINLTFSKAGREKTIFDNYTALSPLFNFKDKPQFVRMGFFHIEKDRENTNASFFTRLIENKIYDRAEVISIGGFLTKSRVLWDVKYDDHKHYLNYTSKGGFGIGDYWKEYFKGIGHLKRTKLSNLTLYALNRDSSPYRNHQTDLMEIKVFPKKSNKDDLKGKTTTDYFDYALLISNSDANGPIEELDR
jgi:hypothetical protein